MKIAVSSQPPGGLDALVDPRFGRCFMYTLVEVDNNEIKSVDIVENIAAQGFSGAGIQAAQLVANLGANVVISGNFGPNAFMSLQQLGIIIIGGVAGLTVKNAIDMYLSGQLQPITGASVPGKFGMGMGGGRGMGMGGGRGMGMGRGRRWEY